MSEEEYKKIFSKNLKYYMDLSGKNQMNLVNDLNLSQSTVSNWCTGAKLPRMAKVQMLANYFGIEKSDLLEEKKVNTSKYYINPETAQAAQEIFENNELRALFDVQKDLEADDLRALHNMALALKRKERGMDDTGC